jgi:hypothetical protein
MEKTQSARETIPSVSSADQESYQTDKELVDKKKRRQGMDVLHFCCM